MHGQRRTGGGPETSGKIPQKGLQCNRCKKLGIHPAVKGGGERSHKISKRCNKTVRDKRHTWNKSLRENAKRKTDLLKTLETTVKDEKIEDNERSIIKNTL